LFLNRMVSPSFASLMWFFAVVSADPSCINDNATTEGGSLLSLRRNVNKVSTVDCLVMGTGNDKDGDSVYGCRERAKQVVLLWETDTADPTIHGEQDCGTWRRPTVIVELG